MQLEYIDRETYRSKTSPVFINALHERYGDFYLLPEGGSNQLALKGCAEIVMDIDMPLDIITIASGTGATLAGIATALNTDQHAIGFAALKGADFLSRDVAKMLAEFGQPSTHNWHIENNYHFGGYAKTSPELFAFIRQFKSDFDIELDAVYPRFLS